MQSVVLFSGQGSQYVGMAKKILSRSPNNDKISQMYKCASDLFKRDLLDLCNNGPKEELDKTINCQAAIFVTSLANIELALEKQPDLYKNCIATAGFSVGEYAALVFSGALKFENALNLLKVRSKIMQTASDSVPSGLMSIFINHKSNWKLLIRAAEDWCTKKLKLDVPVTCQVANMLTPEIKVIGGNEEALNFIQLNHKEFHVDRVKRLAVSGAFHTRLMATNIEEANSLKDLLLKTEINKPTIPTYSNVTGHVYKSKNDIVHLLSQQFHQTLKWEPILHNLYSNITFDVGSNIVETYESGPGKQLGVLLKLVNNKAFKYYKPIDS